MQTKMWITFFNTIRCVDKWGKVSTTESTANKKLSTLKNVEDSTNNPVLHQRSMKQQQKQFSTKQKRNNLLQLRRKKKILPKSTNTTLATAFYIYNI